VSFLYFFFERHDLHILFIGDIVGRPGRKAISKILPDLRHELALDLVIANGENLAGGKGVTNKTTDEMYEYGVDVLTGGNHSWRNKEGVSCIAEMKQILRPANYPENMGIPGSGATIFDSVSGFKIGVVNILGRVFMPPMECPFQCVKKHVDILRKKTNIILVDFHAEATSEKVAMGWYLENDVSAILGTHTHVQTADERILPGGAAYITDVGMTGSHDGVIGVKKEIVLENMLKRLPVRHELSTTNLRINAVVIQIDPKTGKAQSIERINRSV
jgi:2',3'-cyclic-nucleotide 2'-phosphodiesterase